MTSVITHPTTTPVDQVQRFQDSTAAQAQYTALDRQLTQALNDHEGIWARYMAQIESEMRAHVAPGTVAVSAAVNDYQRQLADADAVILKLRTLVAQAQIVLALAKTQAGA